jgi:uncharacterized coiled-coil DUF342 family protein
LRRDNDFLEEELKRIKTAMVNDKKNGSSSEKAELLKSQIEAINKKIQEVSDDIISVDRQVSEKEKQYAKKRGALGLLSKTSADGSGKLIASMANRLDKTLVRFNKTIEGNEKLREQIDILRFERLAFNGVYKTYERELLEKKRVMNDIVQVSTAAYESR